MTPLASVAGLPGPTPGGPPETTENSSTGGPFNEVLSVCLEGETVSSGETDGTSVVDGATVEPEAEKTSLGLSPAEMMASLCLTVFSPPPPSPPLEPLLETVAEGVLKIQETVPLEGSPQALVGVVLLDPKNAVAVDEEDPLASEVLDDLLTSPPTSSTTALEKTVETPKRETHPLETSLPSLPVEPVVQETPQEESLVSSDDFEKTKTKNTFLPPLKKESVLDPVPLPLTHAVPDAPRLDPSPGFKEKELSLESLGLPVRRLEKNESLTSRSESFVFPTTANPPSRVSERVVLGGNVPPVPVQAEPKDLIEHIRFGLVEGRSNVKVSLIPRELGELTILLETRGESVSVKFQVENTSARDAVSLRAGELTASLRDMGWKVDRFSVDLAGTGTGAYSGQDSSQGRSDRSSNNLLPVTEESSVSEPREDHRRLNLVA